MQKRVCCILLSFIMLMEIVVPVRATTISGVKKDQQKTQNNLNSVNQQITAIQSDQAQAQEELDQLSDQLVDILTSIDICQDEIAVKEKEIEQANAAFQEILDEQIYVEEGAAKNVSEIQLEEANIRQKTEFAIENLERIQRAAERFAEEIEKVKADAELSEEDAKKKQADIEEIEKTILASDDTYASLVKELMVSQLQKEEMNTEYKGFFEKREEVSRQMNELDKEIFRLNQQREKLEEALESQQNYMWEEYELTFNNAKALRNEEYDNLTEMKKSITQIKEDIRKLGDVNVNAIEEYKEISERYGFLKGQHDDLIEAEQTLLGIIEDLDTGMKRQFAEKFADIQREFDKAFKELFGGGKGTLELVEEEDLLESGIRIIAQPPGKKLQNMMQLSGGEKALSAISLLFAIQNLSRLRSAC